MQNLPKALPLSFFICFTFIFSLSGFCQENSNLSYPHYSGKNVKTTDRFTYNLSEFSSRSSTPMTPAVAAAIDVKYKKHPDYGTAFHPYYTEAVELPDQK